MLKELYRAPLGLLTDLYQLSMAYAGWKTGQKDKEAVFDLYFRQNPFGSGYALCSGLEYVLDYIEGFRYSQEDLDYLAGLTGSDGRPLFETAFLKYLRKMELQVDVDAIEEGRVVFAPEPLLRVQGPLIQCQLLETPLLNMVNFQTLVATKASRIKAAAGSAPILEFGLRRAQGIDGGLTASRAAYLGGADATSNVLAGRIFGIPVKGTHAHSWVMSFEDEREAFQKFAEAMPGNCTLLVDTYNTIEGVKRAIETGKWLKSQGHSFDGIRLDSGDLAFLSIEARALLDAAGLQDAAIVASNDLDENIITSLQQQGARISAWGVGTRLVTAFDQPALGGVFKLVASREKGGAWSHRIKLSEQLAKTSTPGIHQVRRFSREGELQGDMIFNLEKPPATGDFVIVDPLDATRRRRFPATTHQEDLLIPVVRHGKVCYQKPELKEIRARGFRELGKLHPTIRRLVHPHQYPVGLEAGLHEIKCDMILEMRGFERKGAE